MNGHKFILNDIIFIDAKNSSQVSEKHLTANFWEAFIGFYNLKWLDDN
jgi:hypothetical protein